MQDMKAVRAPKWRRGYTAGSTECINNAMIYLAQDDQSAYMQSRMDRDG